MISNRIQTTLHSASSIRDLFEEGKKLAELYGTENIFNFSIGNPSVPPPPIVNETFKEMLDTVEPLTLHGYPANVGHADVRGKIAGYLNKTFGTHYDVPNIIMTNGAAAALVNLCNVFLDSGDEVIAFTPCFCEYKSYVESFGGNLIPAPCDQTTMQPDPITFEAAFTAKTKMVIVNTPNNPTGAVYTRQSLQMISDILERKQKEYGHPIYLISDEPYRNLVYGGVEVPYITEFYKNTIIVYSYSKTLSIPGERIGYLALESSVDGFDDIIAAVTASIRALGYVGAPSLQQKILLKCYNASVDVGIYEKSRDVFYQGLTALGYECLQPDGAFYLFIKALEEDDCKFCEEAKKERIIMAPGSAFYGHGWARISYCVPHKVATASLDGFKRLMERYQKMAL